MPNEIVDPGCELQDRATTLLDPGWHLDGSANTGADFRDYGSPGQPHGGSVVMECKESSIGHVARFGQIWSVDPVFPGVYTISFWCRKTFFVDSDPGDRQIELSMYNVFPVPGVPFDPSDPLPGGAPMGRLILETTETDFPIILTWYRFEFTFQAVFLVPSQPFVFGVRFKHLGSGGTPLYNLWFEFDDFELLSDREMKTNQYKVALVADLNTVSGLTVYEHPRDRRSLALPAAVVRSPSSGESEPSSLSARKGQATQSFGVEIHSKGTQTEAENLLDDIRNAVEVGTSGLNALAEVDWSMVVRWDEVEGSEHAAGEFHKFTTTVEISYIYNRGSV